MTLTDRGNESERDEHKLFDLTDFSPPLVLYKDASFSGCVCVVCGCLCVSEGLQDVIVHS